MNAEKTQTSGFKLRLPRLKQGASFTKLWIQDSAADLEIWKQTNYYVNNHQCQGYFLHHVARATVRGINHRVARQVTVCADWIAT